MKTIKIGNRLIGETHPVFIVAEVGANFTTLEEAKKEIDLATECGVDAVKFQTLRADTLVTRESRFSTTAGGANQYELFKRFEISEDWHREIFDYAAQRGILVFSTPSYCDDVDLLERFQTPVFKIGSDDLTNPPFLKYVAAKKKPVILSTGMANLDEVREAVETIRSAGNFQLVILHCVSSYPVRDFSDLNLKAIETLRRTFEIPVGFSDHTSGTLAACIAVSLGACVVEKHFTLDKGLGTPDSFFSADPAEMRELVGMIRETERALGSPEKKPTEEEKKNRLEMRKSVVAKTKIGKGEVIKPESLIIKRPGFGIEPKRLPEVIGKKALCDLEADEVISWDKIG